ncbi:MAG: GntR family transcriptional regulator [Clostridia bacterium]|nr:GntR family transcriptional regulator [Clostridia bacterium]
MVKLDYKNDKPLHEQITQGIKELIISGVLTTDEQLPSVRELSVSLTVNPNTVQRAYRTLEADGIIYSIRGKGNFVAKVPEADKTRLDALYSVLKDTLKELAFYGEAKERIENVVKNIYEERDELND